MQDTYDPIVSLGYFSFVAFAAVLTVIPGPAIVLIMKNAVLRGRRGALVTAAGVFSGLVWVTASIAGLTALLVAYRPAFEALRFLGAAYLIYLGVRLFLNRGHLSDNDQTPAQSARGRTAGPTSRGSWRSCPTPRRC